jgi:hypothetical protein
MSKTITLPSGAGTVVISEKLTYGLRRQIQAILYRKSDIEVSADAVKKTKGKTEGDGTEGNGIVLRISLEDSAEAKLVAVIGLTESLVLDGKTVEVTREVIEGLDADDFDAISEACDQVVEPKKKEKKSGSA